MFVTRPTFSLAYTSARAGAILPILFEWIRKAEDPANVEISLCVDSDNSDCLRVLDQIADRTVIKTVQPGPGTCVSGWNLAAEKTHGIIIAAISDDFHPPWHWDTRVLEAGPSGWTELPRVMRVNDGLHNIMCTLPFVTRARYEQQGFLYYPAYRSMFCDADLTELAYRDRVIIEADHLVFQHRHWANGLRPKDSIDQVHHSDERWANGRKIFHERRKSWYPGYNGPLLFRDPVTVDDLKTRAQESPR
jgi:hypothetical protein